MLRTLTIVALLLATGAATAAAIAVAPDRSAPRPSGKLTAAGTGAIIR